MAEAVFPVSFRDPTYAALDARTEAKLGLPDGLLSSIRENGERTNADRVSEAGARTPYQIIPATRDAAIKRWGIDPWLSPQNAAEVAGLLLKDSLDRRKGDVALAVTEYHGGTLPANWGPRTKAYVQRVTAALGAAPAAAPAATGTSTFDRAQQQMQAAQAPSQLKAVYEAYQAGQMEPEEAAEFEADVRAGKMMLPRGATLKTAAGPGAAAGAGAVIPQGVVDAYWDGKMTPQEKAEFEGDVSAGLVKLPPGVSLRAGRASQIPGQSAVAPPAQQVAAGTPRSLLDTARGAIEAGVTAVTGATGGTAGMVAGAVGGVAGALATGQFGTPEGVKGIEQAAIEGAQALTYVPRTEAGQEMAAAVGQAAQHLIPIAPLTGEMAALARGAAAAKPAVQVTAGAAADTSKKAAQAVRDKAVGMTSAATRKMMGIPEGDPEVAGAMGSVGAAGTNPATMRRATAANLPVPMELTTGQATRNHTQLSFEGEVAKRDVGQALRENGVKQNQQLAQQFDALIDDVGARAPNVLETGRIVVTALREALARHKTKTRVLYQQADKTGELAAPVNLQPLADYLNTNRAGRSSAPILSTIADELGVQGVGSGSLAEGSLTAGAGTLKQAEALRKAVNRFVKDSDPNDLRVGIEIKQVIDQITEGVGGDVYKAARASRQRGAQLFENNAVINDLLRTKRGTTDRAVALEDVFRRTILNGSREDLSMLRRTLQVAGGEGGHQAWRELQGQTARYLLEESLKNVGRDIAGNPIFSAAGLDKAVRALDVDDRLKFILGERRAQAVRDINEIAKVVLTFPPGSLNSSNTASALGAMVAEMAAMGTLTGIPAPLYAGFKFAAKQIRDRATRQRILVALGKGSPIVPAPGPRPAGAPVH